LPKICNKCNKKIPEEYDFCCYCGAQQQNNLNETLPFSKMINVNDKYYFNAFDKISHYYYVWNWSSFFFGMFWFAYRKMFLFIPFPYILAILINLLLYFFTRHPLNPVFAILLSAVLCGVFGNSIYKKHLQNLNNKINSLNINYAEKLQMVKRKTGTSRNAAIILFLIIFVLLGFVAISAINDIRTRELERKKEDKKSTFDNVGEPHEGSFYIWDKKAYLWQIKKENNKYYVFTKKDDGTWAWFLLSQNFDINNPDIENNILFEAFTPYPQISNSSNITPENFEEKISLTKRKSWYDNNIFKGFFNEFYGMNTKYTYEYIGTTTPYEFSLPGYEYYTFDVYRVNYSSNYKVYYLVPFNEYFSPPTVYEFIENTNIQHVWYGAM